MAYATSNIWNEDFTTDTIKTTGDPSYDYWLRTETSDNANCTFSYNISNGILTLTTNASGTYTAQVNKFKRLIDIENNKTEVKVALKFYGSSVSRGVAYWLDDAHCVFNFYIKAENNFLYYDYSNSSGIQSIAIGNATQLDLMNKWLYLDLLWENKTNTLTFKLQKENSISYLVNVKITDSIYGLDDATFCRLEQAIPANTNTFTEFKIDYIHHITDFPTDVIYLIMPSIVALVCMGVALGFLKKAMG
jgi:hypothetical protein